MGSFFHNFKEIMKKFLIIAAIIGIILPTNVSAYTIEQDGKGLIDKSGVEYKITKSISLFADYKFSVTNPDHRDLMTPRLIKAVIKYNF